MEYPVLRALAAEWDAALRGAVVAEAYTQARAELSLSLEAPGGPCTLRVRCDGARPLVWRSEGHGRARRNTAAVLPDVEGRAVTGVRVARRDRFLYLDLDDGSALLALPFGPRPTVLHVDAGGTVRAAFLHERAWTGKEAPAPDPAPEVPTPEAFRARWRPRKTVGRSLAAVLPALGRTHADEAARRAGLDPEAPPTLDDAALDRLFAAAYALEQEIAGHPRPHVYQRGGVPEALALAPLTDPPPDWSAQAFETADAAARVWAARSLAAARFLARFRPLEGALAAAAARLERRADGMADALAHPSRADRYEHHAHLLMAGAAGQGPGADTITLPDVMGDGSPVEIRLDPALSAVENAQRLYARARETRQARAHAEGRWAEAAAAAERAAALLADLRTLDGADALDAWRRAHEAALAPLLRADAAGEERLPYRRFVLPGGWEARVGRGARDNAELTTRHAGPHDLWLHARGVPGSHVVLRRPAKTAAPGRDVVEAAAALAAHFSKARTQALVPVTVTERKYVRPVKGGPPGLVRVDREDVLMVAPGLPDPA